MCELHLMKISIIFLFLFLFSCTSFAGGYDVSNLWSAKYSAVGGAAVSNVEGAQAVYFNPAGLAQSHSIEWDLNINTAFVQKSAPLKSDGTSPTAGNGAKHTKILYTPVNGLFYSKKVRKKLGIGAGLYVAGGSGGKFEDINFGNQFTALKPDIDSTIFFIELGIGAGLQLSPEISIGAAWRPTFLSMNAKAAVPTDLTMDDNPDILLAPELKDVNDFILSGFRLGIKYAPSGAIWGLGASLRSEDKFSAKGTSGGSSELAASGTKNSIDGGDVTAISRIPMKLSFGAHIDQSSQLRFMTQYDYIRNERVKSLALSGDSLNVTGIGEIPISTLSIPADWKNQHSFRFGSEYRLPEVWTIRGGYVLSTQVVRNDSASPTATSPGTEHSFNFGGGRKITLFKTTMELDLAIEYVTASGEGKNSRPGSLDGDYDTKALSFFTALAYRL